MESTNVLYDTPEYLVVDTETTRPTILGKIVQIGIVLCNAEDQTSQITFQSFVNEGLTENDKNSWIFGVGGDIPNQHPLNFDDVVNSPPLETKRWELQNLFKRYPITAYNSYFDISHFLLRGFEINQLLPCPMVNMANVMKIKYNKSKKNPKLKFPKFEQAFHYLYPDIPYKELHTAGDDALHEGMIYNAMLKREMIRPYRFDYIDIYLETPLDSFRLNWNTIHFPENEELHIKFILNEIDKLLDRIVVKFTEIVKKHPIEPSERSKMFQMLWNQLSIRYRIPLKGLYDLINNNYLINDNPQMRKIINSDFYIDLNDSM